MSLDTCQPCPRYLQYPRMGGWAGERAGRAAPQRI